MLLRRQPCPPALLDVIGQLPNRFIRDGASLTALERSLSSIDGNKDFCSAAFPLLPKRKGLADSFLLAAYTTTLYRLPHKGLLVGGEVNFHSVRLGGHRPSVNPIVGIAGRSARATQTMLNSDALLY